MNVDKRINEVVNAEVFIAYVLSNTGNNGLLSYDTVQDFLDADIYTNNLVIVRAYINDKRYCYYSIKALKDALR